MYVPPFQTENRTRKTEAYAIFLNLFAVCSSCKRKIIVYRFVAEETNRSYLFAKNKRPNRTCPSMIASNLCSFPKIPLKF